MSGENLDFGSLAEWVSWWEVTEEEKQKVAEDWKAAAQAHKQVKQSQIKNAEFALLLSKILKRYYSNEKIIEFLYSLLHDLDKNEDYIKKVFLPFVDGEGFSSIWDFIDYLRENLTELNPEFIFEVIKFEKIGWEKLWTNVKSWKTEISYEDFKKQILDDLNNLW